MKVPLYSSLQAAINTALAAAASATAQAATIAQAAALGISSTVATSADLPASGTDGTLIMARQTTEIYKRVSGAWVLDSVITPFISPERYGARGDDATDNSLALTGAFAAAKATGREVVFGPGTFRHAATLTVNWDGAIIKGAGPRRTVLKQTDPAKDGLQLGKGPNSVALYGPTVQDLSIQGPGATSTGIGVNINIGSVVNGSHLLNIRVTNFKHNLYTALTDYLQITRSKFEDCNDHCWVADQATNATTVIGSAFHVVTGSTPFGAYPAGKAGLYAIDLDGALISGTEFGQCDIGVVFTNGSSFSVNFIGSRWEFCPTAHVRIGESSAAPTPGPINFIGCTHYGNNVSGNVQNYLIEMFGANHVRIINPVWTQVAATGSFVVARGSQTWVKTTIESAGEANTANTAVFQDHSGNRNWDKRIVIGGDGSSALPSPFVISRVGLTTAGIASGGSAEFLIGVAPRTLKLTDARVNIGNVTVSVDTGNYWKFEVYRRGANGGALTTLLASADTKTSGLFNAALKNAPMTLGATPVMTVSESVVLKVTRVGNPPDYTDMGIALMYIPQ